MMRISGQQALSPSNREHRQLVLPLIIALVMALTFSTFVNASFAAGSDRFLCLSSKSQTLSNDGQVQPSLVEHCSLCFVSMPKGADGNWALFGSNRLIPAAILKPHTLHLSLGILSHASKLIRGPPLS